MPPCPPWPPSACASPPLPPGAPGADTGRSDEPGTADMDCADAEDDAGVAGTGVDAASEPVWPESLAESMTWLEPV